MNKDRFISAHVRYYSREMRIRVYGQFLESYKSVTLMSMADQFGLSAIFLDIELSRFISAGRLNAKIDKVGGIIETNRPDAKNAMYQQVIKHGDQLLNRIQKLTRVVDL
jgi:26S proteasome regulatory subunit N7